VSRSRQETRELRVELRGAIERLPSTSLSAGAGAKTAPGVPAAQAATQEPPPPVAGAETPAEARLSRLEEDQQLLQAKVDEQHQTKVESASKYRVKLSGLALLNLFGNSGTVDNLDVPNLALPPGAVASIWPALSRRVSGHDRDGPEPRLQGSDRLEQAIRIIGHHASNEFPARIGDQYGGNIRNPEGAKQRARFVQSERNADFIVVSVLAKILLACP